MLVLYYVIVVLSENYSKGIYLYKSVMDCYFSVSFVCLSPDLTTLKWMHHMSVKRKQVIFVDAATRH